MVNLITSYRRENGKLWTFVNSNSSKAQLNHILINKKWKNSSIDCKSCCKHSLGWDHIPCSVKLRLCLWTSKKHKANKTYYNRATPSNGENKIEVYSIEIKTDIKFRRIKAMMQLQILCIKKSSKFKTNQQNPMLHFDIEKKNPLGSLPEFVKNVKFYALLLRNSKKTQLHQIYL